MSSIRWRDNGLVYLFAVLIVGLTVFTADWQLHAWREAQLPLQVAIVVESEDDGEEEIELGTALSDEELKNVEAILLRLVGTSVDSVNSINSDTQKFSPELEEEVEENIGILNDQALLFAARRSLTEGNLNITSLLLDKLSLNLEERDGNRVGQRELATELWPDFFYIKAKLSSALGEDEKAVDFYKKVLAIKPAEQASQINLGLSLARLERNTEAVDAFNRAIEISSGSRKAKAYSALATSQLALGKIDHAIKSFQKSIEYRPNHASTWRKLANAQLLANNEPGVVLKNFDQALALRPEYLLALHDRARYFWRISELEKARQDLELIRKKSEEYNFSRWTLLHFYLADGKYRSAQREIDWLQTQDISASQVEFLQVLQAYQLSLRDKKNWHETMGQIRDLLPKQPGNEWLNLYFAQSVLQSFENKSDSQSSEKRLSDVFSEDIMKQVADTLNVAKQDKWTVNFAQITQADIAVADGNSLYAAELLQQLLATNPGNAILAYELGRKFLDAGKPDAAIVPLTKAIEWQPEESQYYLSLALAYSRHDNRKKARETYEKLLDTFPNHKIAHYNFAVMLKDSGDTEDAIQHYQRALELDPQYSNALINLALLWRDQNEFAAAAVLLEDMVAIEPDRSSARELLAETWFEAAQLDKALAEVNRLLQLNPRDVSGKVLKSDILKEQGNIAAAAAQLLSLDASQFEKSTVTKLYNLGVRALRNDDLELAEHCNRRVLALDESRDKALVNLTEVLNRSGREFETIQLLAEADRSANEKLTVNLAHAYILAGQRDAALQLLLALRAQGLLTEAGKAMLTDIGSEATTVE